LRRSGMIEEGFVEDQAGFGLGLAAASALDPKTAALLQMGVSVAIGSQAVCAAPEVAAALGHRGRAGGTGSAEGGYTDMFEIICRNCGDQPQPGLLQGLTRASAAHTRSEPTSRHTKST
jgi:hypothetical protein